MFDTSPSEPSRFDCNGTATKGRIQEKKVLRNFDWPGRGFKDFNKFNLKN